jgi:hypothetical protein
VRRATLSSPVVAVLSVSILFSEPATAQDCLGLPIASRSHAIGARIEPLAGSGREAWLIGGEYLHIRSRLVLGVHGGGIYEELIPPSEAVLGIGGTVAYLVRAQSICPAVSVTRWSPDVESFSSVPGDSDLSSLLFRMGVGLARASGDSVRIVAWFYPHVTSTRTHSTFGDLESTEWEAEYLTDVGAAIGGGRFWGSGALRFQFADDPGEDIPFGAVIMTRVGVRF